MNETRTISRVIKNKPVVEGAGVNLKRVFGFSEKPLLDPFLLLDDFRSDNPADYKKGFPWHPHRGIETITYMLEGNIEHGDSLGNRGTIGSGDLQWMTAGSGIIHQEMPRGDRGGRMYGFQLWANLPSASKMMAPRYQEVKKDAIPEVELEGGVTVRVISGKVRDTRGPVRDIITDPEVLDITIPHNSNLTHPVKKGYTVFAYVIEGTAHFCHKKHSLPYEISGRSYFDMKTDPQIEEGTLVLYDDGDNIKIHTEESSVRFLLVSGKPIKEDVAWHGPIVMNTMDELRDAFHEYDMGTFVKVGQNIKK